jgi:hypothetical protein
MEPDSRRTNGNFRKLRCKPDEHLYYFATGLCYRCGKTLPPNYFAAEPEERKAIMEVEAEAEREANQ